MSDEPHRFRQEDDVSYNLRATGIGVVTLALFLIGIFWAWAILRGREKTFLGSGAVPLPPEATEGRDEVGMVFQHPFDEKKAWPERSASQETRLHDYGWVDRKNNRIHIPIERAMEIYLAEQNK